LTAEMLKRETIYHILETHYNIAIEEGTFHITAAMATSEEAKLLEVGEGTALLLIQRVSYTSGHVAVYVQERYYRPDRVGYGITLKRHGSSGGRAAIQEMRPIFSEEIPQVK